MHRSTVSCNMRRTHCLEQQSSKTFALHVWANPHHADVDEWSIILHMLHSVTQAATVLICLCIECLMTLLA